MLPSVSVIMPCGYGDGYFPVALNCFLRQDYKGTLELIFLDNNITSVEHLLPKDDRIKYHRCERMSIGGLRNRCNELATGDIITHFDEDDWYAADRISTQVESLKESGQAVTGFCNILYYQTAPDSSGGTYKYYFDISTIRGGRFGVLNKSSYATGTSQMYLRDWWGKHPFQSLDRGEDYWFQDAANKAGQLHSVDGGHYVVARAHPGSLSPPMLGHAQFPQVPRKDFPEQFFTDTQVHSFSA